LYVLPSLLSPTAQFNPEQTLSALAALYFHPGPQLGLVTAGGPPHFLFAVHTGGAGHFPDIVLQLIGFCEPAEIE
jgi:hypothetical protein